MAVVDTLSRRSSNPKAMDPDCCLADSTEAKVRGRGFGLVEGTGRTDPGPDCRTLVVAAWAVVDNRNQVANSEQAAEAASTIAAGTARFAEPCDCPWGLQGCSGQGETAKIHRPA